jgi:hypothetical protein
MGMVKERKEIMDWITILLLIAVGLVLLPFVSLVLDFVLMLIGMVIAGAGFVVYLIHKAIYDLFRK